MKRGRFKLNLLFKNTLLFILFFQLSNSVFSQEIIQGAERVDYYFNKLNDKKIANKIAFDRGSYLYHGRVKQLAEGVRSKGINF